MKTFYLQITLSAIVLLSAAFPHISQIKRTHSRQVGCPFSQKGLKTSPLAKRAGDEVAQQSTWSPTQQISVSDVHSFIAPRSTDLRGPCPGLNALSNHGYIARNGITNLVEAAEATQKVFGIAPDMSLLMSTLAVVFAGDPITTKWSIGGPPPMGLLNLGSILFGRPVGLSGTRNLYETDASITRADAFLNNGDSSSLRINLFKGLLAANPNPQVDNFKSYDTWKIYRSIRLQHSIENNPYFFWGPISGVLVGQTGVFFPPELMSNHTPEAPDGILTKQVLYDFYSIKEGDNGKLIYTRGHERIPENWYRQPTDNMTIVNFATLVANLILEYPQTGVIGGNTGTVNSFVGVNVSDLTGGLFKAVDLTDPSKLMCFALQTLDVALPGVLRRILKDLGATASSLLRGALDPIIGGMNCPVITKFDESLLLDFPGITTRLGLGL